MKNSSRDSLNMRKHQVDLTVRSFKVGSSKYRYGAMDTVSTLHSDLSKDTNKKKFPGRRLDSVYGCFSILRVSGSQLIILYYKCTILKC